MFELPCSGLDAWVARFSTADIPVLRRTRRELATLRDNEDSVNGRAIATAVLQDPLMTLRVLAYIETHRRRSQTTDITTIERAIMMIGISPFFRAFESMPCVEDRLADNREALLGLLKVIGRARRAAHYARDWATIRHDLDVDEITVAALLHDLAEILLWCLQPDAALKLRALQAEHPNMRSQAAQLMVLGIKLHALQIELCRAWHLPELLLTLMNDAQASQPRVRNVVCAVNLSRHSANGWSDPALPDDFRDIADLLHVSREAVMMRLGIDPYLADDAGESASGG